MLWPASASASPGSGRLSIGLFAFALPVGQQLASDATGKRLKLLCSEVRNEQRFGELRLERSKINQGTTALHQDSLLDSSGPAYDLTSVTCSTGRPNRWNLGAGNSHQSSMVARAQNPGTNFDSEAVLQDRQLPITALVAQLQVTVITG